MMDRNEINRYIHEEILGKCWASDEDWTWVDNPECPQFSRITACSKCGQPDRNPDYCSDDSPRALLNEVVAKLREIQGSPFPFLDALDGLERDWTVATAEQVARACVAAHQEGRENE